MQRPEMINNNLRQWRTLSRYSLLIPWWVIFFLGACSVDPGTGPQEIKWDRHVCERCRMVLSDRKHSAQIRITTTPEKTEVKIFDDIGCAVIWLQDKPWKDDPNTEIWVNDWRGGQWIDARSAIYLPGQVTPMEYGLGAQLELAERGLDFAQARAHILAVERRFNVHGAHLEHTATERAKEAQLPSIITDPRAPGASRSPAVDSR